MSPAGNAPTDSQPPESVAPGAAAGFVFQFERALARLAQAESYTVEVGIEALDDVAVRDGNELLALEQDKHTLAAEPLTDRSYGLWHSLSIWTDDNERAHANLFLVTNRPLAGTLVAALAVVGPARSSPDELVRLLKQAAAKPARSGRRARTPSRLKKEFAKVLGHTDADLGRTLARVQILGVEQSSRPTRAELAARFGVSPEYDSDFVIDHLLGWLANVAVESWRMGRPAWVSRASCLKICDAVVRRAARRRILPRPGREVVVSATDRELVRGYPFVDHLTAIEAGADDVEQAIEHFLQFGIERHRLVDEGEVPHAEWTDRGDRLVNRWRNIQRRAVRALPGLRPQEVGMKVYEQTTYEHRERICGEECDELYMTSGHYHRLADSGSVWWLPSFGSRDAD